MKINLEKLFFFLIINFILISSISQINRKWADFKILNCEPVKENYLWAARTELTNLQYKEFLWHIKKDLGDSVHRIMIPDTNCWNKNLSYNSPYIHYYLQDSKYNEFPLVGVSHKQAKAYCEWLTRVLNQVYQKDEKHPVYELIVRLPNEEEWENAAKAGNPSAIFPWKGTKLRNQEKKYEGNLMANFLRGKNQVNSTTDDINKIMDVIAPAKSYWPNDFGLYCMSGNIAEMINQPRRKKGGSWASNPLFIEINSKDEFKGWEKPSPKIGFRYFIEIIEFKNKTKTKDIKINANDKIFIERLPYRPETAILTGEVKTEKLILISAEQRQSLAEALYDKSGAFIIGQSDTSQLFVIREIPERNIVAYHLDASNPARLTLATKFELRPNDIIFVAPQFITNYNRALGQIYSALAMTQGP